MPLDYDALLYDPIYSALGVNAVIDLGTDGEETIRVIDKTAGVEVDAKSGAGHLSGVQVLTTRPCADARMSELARKGIAVDVLDGATITFSGQTWEIKAHTFRPSPSGERNGEVRLILMANT